MFTELNGRQLWYDGANSVNTADLLKLLQKGISIKGVFVNEMTPDIEKFNQLVPVNAQISIKRAVASLDFGWNIPGKYFQIPLLEYIFDKFDSLARKESFTEEERAARLNRILDEMELYVKLGLLDVLRLMIYIIDTFKENNVVWGVGRGSSVSSYVLYLIEVHDIDSVKWNLDIEDFLKTK